MITDLVLVLATCFVGLLAGAECTTLVIHSTLDRLPVEASRVAVQETGTRMGSLMPAVMPTTVLLLVAAGLLRWGSVAAVLLLAAAGAIVVMLLITFLGLAPLNSLQGRADASTPAETWFSWRDQWMGLHRLRVACDLTALVLTSIAVVSA